MEFNISEEELYQSVWEDQSSPKQKKEAEESGDDFLFQQKQKQQTLSFQDQLQQNPVYFNEEINNSHKFGSVDPLFNFQKPAAKQHVPFSMHTETKIILPNFNDPLLTMENTGLEETTPLDFGTNPLSGSFGGFNEQSINLKNSSSSQDITAELEKLNIKSKNHFRGDSIDSNLSTKLNSYYHDGNDTFNPNILPSATSPKSAKEENSKKTVDLGPLGDDFGEPEKVVTEKKRKSLVKFEKSLSQ
ncbi:hypothetical protein HK099_008260, partial [Clydaea vesicula]